MRHVKKIELINFESHESTVIHPSEGLNIITGESNHGKSSIVSAMRIIYRNNRNGTELTGSIMAGKEYFKIAVHFEDGFVVEREKNKKTINRYNLVAPDGTSESFSNFSKKRVPEEIEKILGIHDLKYDESSTIDFNFLAQIESSFLLQEKATVKSKIMGMLRGSHYIDEAIRDVAGEIKKNTGAINSLIEETGSRRETLKEYMYLDEVEKKMSLVVEKVKVVKENQAQIIRLRQANKDLAAINERMKESEQILKASEPVREIEKEAVVSADNIQQLGKGQELIEGLEVTQAQLNDAQAIVNKAQDIEKQSERVERLESIVTKTTMVKDYADKLKKNLSRFKGIQTAIGQTEGIEAIQKESENAFSQHSSIFEMQMQIAELRNAEEAVAEYDDILKHGAGVNKALQTVEKLDSLKTGAMKMRQVQKQILIEEARFRDEKNVLYRTRKLPKDVSFIEAEVDSLKEKSFLREGMVRSEEEIEQIRFDSKVHWKQLKHTLPQYLKALKEEGACPVCGGAIHDDVLTQIEESYMSLG